MSVKLAKIGVIIPDRCDRPLFRKHCEYLLKQQTIYSSLRIIWMDQDPLDEAVDITKRYRIGYQSLSKHYGVDVIAFMENDDWYAPNYLETMVRAWIQQGRPDLFGTTYTIYYHLKLKKYFTFHNSQKSHMMNTLIKPGLTFNWPPDHDPYTDQWLWMGPSNIQKKLVIKPAEIISIGMKHGVGLCGGRNHVNQLNRFTEEDNGFLKNTVDPKSFDFYNSLTFTDASISDILQA